MKYLRLENPDSNNPDLVFVDAEQVIAVMKAEDFPGATTLLLASSAWVRVRGTPSEIVAKLEEARSL